MDLQSFRNTKWVQAGSDPKNFAKVIGEVPVWVKKVQNSELCSRALKLWGYLVSGKCSKRDIILLVGVLLYLVSPIDAVPDFIPIAGWLDDAAIAGLVLSYLEKKVTGQGT